MAALDFPDSPTVGQVFDKWTWNGTMWVLTPGTGAGYVFVQDTTPTARKVGDTWFDTSTGATGGTSWVAIEEGAVGSEKVWVQTSPMSPPAPAAVGGIWRRAAALSIPNATLTNIIWDAEDADSGNILNVGTTSAVIPETGIYSITFMYAPGPHPATAQLVTDGTYIASNTGDPVSGWTAVSMTGRLPAGQTVFCRVWQNSGAAVAPANCGRLEIWKVA